ncbi:MAG TPA: hypothetical protein DHV48_10315 [Prolixibacteraceae bacterium]|nr:hypothetical protein [Prolixibacteraceae bacterium]
MWTDYFNFIKLRRGRVITPFHGEIDFSRDDIPLEICKELFDKGFPYLELTEMGKQELYLKSIDLLEEIVSIPTIGVDSNPMKKASKKQDTYERILIYNQSHNLPDK